MTDALRADIEHVSGTYAAQMPNYEALALRIHSIIEESLPPEIVHTLEHRPKSLASFAKKASKLNDDGSLKYPNAPKDITDLAGVRVIVFTRDAVDAAISSIEGVLSVFDKEDVGDRVYQQGRFGYQSKHLLLRLGDDRKHLGGNASFKELTCEVQVRTILQHAWAELEHDIQYKSANDIPVDLNKRFSALAGLLEIADREFQAIQNDSVALKESVKAEFIDELTRETLSEGGGTSDSSDSATPSARELVEAGQYSEAVKSFSDKIALFPSNHTLFIGRARARFLMGDLRGALADLGESDRLNPASMASTSRLRFLIENGKIDEVVRGYNPPAEKTSEGLRAAGSALTNGDGERAFIEYEKLEGFGYNWALAQFGKSASCVLDFDLNGANAYLARLEPRPSTPMAVNINALICIISIISGRYSTEQIDTLRAALGDAPMYDLSASPLRNVFDGFKKKKVQKRFPQIDQVEDILQRRG